MALNVRFFFYTIHIDFLGSIDPYEQLNSTKYNAA